MDRKKLQSLVQVARLYYEHDKTQSGIAEILDIDRSKVSRLLTQTREMGIVQFQIVDPTALDRDLVVALQKRFGLDEAIVFNANEVAGQGLKKAIGLTAADYLESTLKEGDILAVSWGETIYHTIENLRPNHALGITVVPAVGGSGLISPAYQVNDLVQRAASVFEGIHKSLYAPAFVSSLDVRDELQRSKDIKVITEYWEQATVALLGVGKSPFAYRSAAEKELQFGEFYIRPEELEEIRDHEIVGDINGRFFDPKGLEQSLSIHNRVIGMTLADLARVPKKIGVAGGLDKVEAIRAALVGNHLDVLITNQKTARRILEETK